jgi:hypothetical protein
MINTKIVFDYARDPMNIELQQKIIDRFWSIEYFLDRVNWIVWEILRINYDKTKKQD